MLSDNIWYLKKKCNKESATSDLVIINFTKKKTQKIRIW